MAGAGVHTFTIGFTKETVHLMGSRFQAKLCELLDINDLYRDIWDPVISVEGLGPNPWNGHSETFPLARDVFETDQDSWTYPTVLRVVYTYPWDYDNDILTKSRPLEEALRNPELWDRLTSRFRPLWTPDAHGCLLELSAWGTSSDGRPVNVCKSLQAPDAPCTWYPAPDETIDANSAVPYPHIEDWHLEISGLRVRFDVERLSLVVRQVERPRRPDQKWLQLRSLGGTPAGIYAREGARNLVTADLYQRARDLLDPELREHPLALVDPTGRKIDPDDDASIVFPDIPDTSEEDESPRNARDERGSDGRDSSDSWGSDDSKSDKSEGAGPPLKKHRLGPLPPTKTV